MITIDRFIWGNILVSSISFILGFLLLSDIILGVGMVTLFLGYLTMMIGETRRHNKWIKDITEEVGTDDERLLAFEVEMYLIRYWGARQGVFICPKCDMASYNPNDLKEGYCGQCHEFTGPRYPGASEFGS